MWDTNLITIYVSARPRAFSIHENLLTYWSPYFRNAFNGSFREADEKEITLEDVDPWTFKTVVGWLYSQHIVLEKPDNQLPEPENEEDVDSDRTLVEELPDKELSTLLFKRNRLRASSPRGALALDDSEIH